MTMPEEADNKVTEIVENDAVVTEDSQAVAETAAEETPVEQALENTQPEDAADENAEQEAVAEEAPVEEVVAEADQVAENTGEGEDPFSVQQSDEAVNQMINPLENNDPVASDDAGEADESPLKVIDEEPREQRVPGLPEIFFKALDNGTDPAEAFAMVRDAQLEREGLMTRDDMAFGLDAAETAFNDALETGSTPEEAFVMAGDAASRVMASRGFGKAA